VPKANAPKQRKLGEMEIVAADRLGDALSASME
jgi:DNA repair protein RadA/Sms